MWPFSEKKEEETVPKLEYVRFGNHEYNPADDITVKEVALLLPVFAGLHIWCDRKEYIEKHNLMRHFKEVEK